MTQSIYDETFKVGRGGGFLIHAARVEDIFTFEDLSTEQRQIAEMTETFAEERILSQTAAIESKNFEVTRSLIREAGELGLLGIDVPEEYGGMELDKVTSTLVADCISVSGSFSVSFGGQVGIGLLPLIWYGTHSQKTKYLPRLISGEWVAAYALSESSAGSDAMNIRTKAVLSPEGTHYLISGEKMWITNAGFADIFTVFAKIDGERFSAFLIERDTPGLTIGAEEHKLGLRGSSTCPLVLNDCRVPVENLLGLAGKGHQIAFNILNIGRYKLAATGLGAARIALRDGIRYGRDRISFGKPVTSFGLVQEMIAESSAKIFALESTLYRVVGDIDRALSQLDKSLPTYTRDIQKCIEGFAVECSIVKVFGSEVLNSVADRMLQVHGGYGYVEDYAAERTYRDSRIHRIFEGTNEINRLIVVKWTMKRAAQGEYDLASAMNEVATQSHEIADELSDGPLAAQKKSVKTIRQATLCCLQLASRRFGEHLSEQQEIVGALADLFIQLVAMESCVLRAEKMNCAPIAVALAQYFVSNALSVARSSCERVLGAVVQGLKPKEWSPAFEDLMAPQLVDTVAVGRQISDAMVAAGRYAL